MRIGEIVETTSTGFVAESFELNSPPPLGSVVTIDVAAQGAGKPTEAAIYAVVTFGQTAGLDPSRRAIRRSTDTVFDQAVYDHNPELDHVLRTEFGAALVGFVADGHVRQHLPTQPPPLHFSVQSVAQRDLRRFTDSLDYFRLLLTATGPVLPAQVLAAHMREVYQQRDQDRVWLEAAAREIAILLKDDQQALLTVLYAIDPGPAPSSASRPEVER
jgi:hypothetical protein